MSLLYGDFEGGQRIVTQFSLRYAEGTDKVAGGWMVSAARHLNVDGPDPR